MIFPLLFPGERLLPLIVRFNDLGRPLVSNTVPLKDCLSYNWSHSVGIMILIVGLTCCKIKAVIVPQKYGNRLYA